MILSYLLAGFWLYDIDFYHLLTIDNLLFYTEKVWPYLFIFLFLWAQKYR